LIGAACASAGHHQAEHVSHVFHLHPFGLAETQTRLRMPVHDSGVFPELVPNARAYANAVDPVDALKRRARRRSYSIRVSELIILHDFRPREGEEQRRHFYGRNLYRA
jgi:hypothetical protein